MNKIRTAIAPCYRRFARSSAAVASNAPSSIKRDSKIIVARTFATRDNDDNNYDYGEPSSSSNSTADAKRGRRVWRAIQDTDDEWTNILNNKNDSIAYLTADGTSSAVEIQHWNMAVDDVDDSRLVNESLSRICEQEREGGRMKQSQLGVLREDPHEDMRLLMENFTVSSLASAVRDREDTLQHCATLLSQNRIAELTKILNPYERQFILSRRRSKEKILDFRGGFNNQNIELLRKGLNRMPRTVSTAYSKRAGVVLPLCNVDGIPCILFEKRSRRLRAHPDEVCLPGGMVSEGDDKTIIQTCLREMDEEIGVGSESATVLGVLRCNWGEVHHLVGVAVTPVVCYLGDLDKFQLHPNPDECAECFTVPLELFLDRDRWVHKQHYAPFFTGGPHIIWGLTGYIIHRLVIDLMEQYKVLFDT